jgi:hypothetical protein
MRPSLRSLNDVLTTAVLWVVSIYGLSKVVGSGSWRWTCLKPPIRVNAEC